MTAGSGAESAPARPIGALASQSGVLCLLAFVALNFWMIWKVRDLIARGYGDFASFYTAGRIVKNGDSAKLYEPVAQWRVQQEFASTVTIRRGPLPYIRPPFEAVLFLPFAYLNYPTACLVWIVLKILLLMTVPFLLPRIDPGSRGRSDSVLEVLLCLAFFPVAFDLIQGQDSILLLLIVVVAFRLLLRGSDFGCGAVLALGLFKFHLTIPLLAIFVLRRKGRVVLGFLAVAALLCLVTIRMVNWQGILAYPKYLWSLNQVPGLGMVKPQSMPNVRGLLTLFLGNESLPTFAHGILFGVVVLGIILAARFWRRGDSRSAAIGYSFAIVVVILTSYYANSYDLTLLLLPLLLLRNTFLLDSGIVSWSRTLFLVAAAVLLCTPFSWILALRIDQFRWMALILGTFAVSIFAAAKSWEGCEAAIAISQNQRDKRV